LIQTETTLENLQSLAGAIQSNDNCILIEGESASGKSCTIEEIALITGNQGIIFNKKKT
jgi:midasin (ATPase involved in ribosome maturation)